MQSGVRQGVKASPHQWGVRATLRPLSDTYRRSGRSPGSRGAVSGHAEGPEYERADQDPRRHCKAQEPPGHLTALAAPGEDLTDDLSHRGELQQDLQRRSAGRQRAGRQVLHVHVASGHADRGQRGGGYQHRVDACSPPPGVMKRSDQEDESEGGNPDALEDAQGTRLETEPVLRVQGVGEKRDTRAETREIDQSTIVEHARIVLDWRRFGINSL
jgi:hypothetical protein